MSIAFVAVLAIGVGLFVWQRVSHAGDATALAKSKPSAKPEEILPPPGAKGSVPAAVAEAPPPAPTPATPSSQTTPEVRPADVKPDPKAYVKTEVITLSADGKTTPASTGKPGIPGAPALPATSKQAAGTGKASDTTANAATRKTGGRQVTIEQLLNEQRAAAPAPTVAPPADPAKGDGDQPVKRREHRDR